jgi:Holliday junction resolvasome RuvABC DNA-binding subunit
MLSYVDTFIQDTQRHFRTLLAFSPVGTKKELASLQKLDHKGLTEMSC